MSDPPRTPGTASDRPPEDIEVLVHPQLSTRDRWRSVQTSAGPIRAILPPPIVEGYEQPMGAVPGLGQHTDAVLSELGIDDEQISRLRTQGVIG